VREKKQKLLMIVIHLDLLAALTVNRSGRAGLKKGADVAVGKWTTPKTEQPQDAVESSALGRKGTVMHR
jgi:hypothetical protein